MDHRLLDSFVVLAEELHFGKAAVRLNITQPALSQHIKALEKTLDIALFTRDRRNVALTYQGEQLLEQARITINHYELFREHARSLRLGFKGQLKLGYVGSSILDPVLALLIKGYRQAKPDIDIVIEEHNVHDQISLLLNKQLDIALVRAPLPQYDELEYLDVITRPLVAVLPRQHPLASQPSVSLSALRNERFFIQQDPAGVGLGWSVLTACQSAGFTPRSIEFTRDVSVAIGLVSMGLGVTLVPQTQCSMVIADLTYCPIMEKDATTTLTLCWAKNSRNNVLADFIGFARAQAE
jgi:DNA-binding transcriptional LysR family regulator